MIAIGYQSNGKLIGIPHRLKIRFPVATQVFRTHVLAIFPKLTQRTLAFTRFNDVERRNHHVLLFVDIDFGRAYIGVQDFFLAQVTQSIGQLKQPVDGL